MSDNFPSTFQSKLIDIPAPPNDPTLSLKLHCLHFKPQDSSNTRPLLLIHGHPQNHLIWRHIAPALSKQSSAKQPWEIVVADLRGHGDSSAPPASQELGAPSEEIGKWRYSKRELGRDLFELMKHFGHESFDVLAHDRGARVAHRMALDRPEAIKSMILLDIAPTIALYEEADSKFATIYYHWYFLIQPYPFPETLIMAAPQAYLEKMTTRFPSSSGPDSQESIFSPRVFQSYLDQISNLPQVHATCSDYRASAPGGPDLTLDEEDRRSGKRIQCKTKIIWGQKGVNQVLFGDRTLELWKDWCQRQEDCTGTALSGGHYLAEESYETLLPEIENFFQELI